MKININTVLRQTISFRKLFIYFICFSILYTTVLSECNAKFGCLARQKFMSYVTVQGKDGTPLPLRTIFNYKVLYIFTDRLVFYTSKDAGSPSLEPEENEKVDETEAKIERVINYGEIILDCGKYHNKLCHGQEYPGIEKIDSFKMVQNKIKNNADVFCLVIPFFENGYEKTHEKMAYICATEAKDLYNIILFKNYLSRKIELYQLKMSNDRYNGFNGLIKRKSKLIARIEGRTIPVIAEISNRGLALSLNDPSKKFVTNYSFYQQRLEANRAYIISEGLARNKIAKDWSAGMSPEPSPDCCMYFKGESENLTLCIASSDGQSIEAASDICKIKIRGLNSEIWNSLRGIRFAESYHELSHNMKKLNDCKSNEYKIMKYRAEKTILYAINVDCKYVMNYISTDDMRAKIQFCHKNYGDELKLELKLMSLDNDAVYVGINNCVYKSQDFRKKWEEEYFNGN